MAALPANPPLSGWFSLTVCTIYFLLFFNLRKKEEKKEEKKECTPCAHVRINAQTMASLSSSANKSKKRKRVVLTIDSKLAILDRLKGGATQAKLADEYGTSTVGEIKKDEAKIRSFASTTDGMAMSKKGRKVMRLSDDDKLNEAVYQWFVQKQSQDMPVSGPVLCEKAVQLHKQLHEGSTVPFFRPVEAGFGNFVIGMELGNSLCREKGLL